MNHPTPKQYLPLNGKPIATYSFQLLIASPHVDEVIVVCDPKYQMHFPGARFAQPGLRRQDSLASGLALAKHDLVLTHDAARPFLTIKDLEAVIEAGKVLGAATLASRVHYTIKRCDKDKLVTETIDRENLYEIHTPQVIRKSYLEEGLKTQQPVTDDTSLAELAGYPVKLIEGSVHNRKITTQEDLALAEKLLQAPHCL